MSHRNEKRKRKKAHPSTCVSLPLSFHVSLDFHAEDLPLRTTSMLAAFVQMVPPILEVQKPCQSHIIKVTNETTSLAAAATTTTTHTYV